MLNDSIQGANSMNCMPASAASKPAQTGSTTANPASAPNSASQRVSAALRSAPVTSTRMPARTGSQITVESGGRPSIRRPFSSACEPQRQQHEHPDDHGERVVVDETGLHLPDHAREPADQPRRAVHENAVDDADVAALPQAAADKAR